MIDPRALIERILAAHADDVWPHVYQLLGGDPGMRDFVVLMAVHNDHDIENPEIEVVSVSEGLRVLSECHMYDVARDVINDRMAAPNASHVLYVVLATDRYMALSSIHFHLSMQPIGEA